MGLLGLLGNVSPVGLIGKVVGGVGGMLERRTERKDKAREQQIELLKAGIDERSNGWKDEVALAVVVLPFIAAFVPGAGPFIEQGFAILKGSTPDWYQYLLTGGLASALGLTVFNKARK